MNEKILEYAPTVMRYMPVAVSQCSADLRYLWVSQRYADWLGLPQEQIVGHRIADVVGEEAVETVRPYIEAVLSGQRVEFESQVVVRGLGRRWLHAELAPTFDGGGIPTGWVAAITDVTTRRRVEERLGANNTALSMLHEMSARLTSQDALKTLLQAVVDAAIILTDAKMGTLRLYDPASRSLRIVAQSGFDKAFIDYFAVVRDDESVCGHSLHLCSRIVVEDIDRSPFFAGRPGHAVMKKAGARAMQITPLASHDGRPLGTLATHWQEPHTPEHNTLQMLDLLAREAADLIEHRQREEALRDAIRSKDEFLAMLGHELRNPLSPIVTALTILKARGNGQYLRTLEIVERQVQYLIRLVDDLLDVSRITRGKIQIKKRPIRLQDVVIQGEEIAMPLIEQRRQHFDVHFPPTELRLLGDEGRLAQVVANLLTNASKYTDPGGRITVEASRQGSEVVLSVRDDGIGIAPELLPHVFDLFTQERQSADRARGGLGIGLTIVRSLVELHGGSVEAQSEGVGKGSLFTVRLPAAPAEPAAVEGLPGAAPLLAARAKRVLVVDDNEDALDLLAEVLRSAGHVVVTAKDGPSALDRMKSFHPDVAILDIGLPVMDGYELAGRIHADFGDDEPRLIALTGYGRDSDRAQTREAGFAEHLTKPVDVDILLAALDTEALH